jgi:NADPH:quinone reductase-like Zn-dependent oxidoreductase
MKAIVYHSYGSPDVLRYADIEKPTPGDHEVLVRVRAASANPLDYHLMGGMWLIRPMTGLRRPKSGRPGADLAGEIEAVGSNVLRLRPGDAVFGANRFGAFAEYACVPETKVAVKPGNLSFEQAAAVPVAGLTALQGLRDGARIQPGQQVLINGAAGGVGTFAVQIARAFGARVTGVCSGRNVDLVRSLGAERVIDYARDDFTRGTERYDLLFDCVGHRSLSDCRGALRPAGTYVGVGYRPGGWLGPLPGLINLLVLSRLPGRRMISFLARVDARDLVALTELIEAGKVTPVIDRRYPLREVPEAIRYLQAGHARGKVVITVDDPERA